MKRLFTFAWALALFNCASAQNIHVSSDEEDCEFSKEYSCRPLIEAEWQHVVEPNWSTERQATEHGTDTHSNKGNVHYRQRAIGVIRAFKAGKHVGGFTSFLISNDEAELSGGPAFRFVNKNVCYDFGLGAGLSKHAHYGIAVETYFAVTAELDNSRIEFFASANYAAPKVFSYHAFLLAYPRPWFGLGLTAQHEGVIGPRFQFGYKGCFIAISGCYNIEKQRPSAIFSLLYRRD